jgi:hypothetical protein
MVIPGPSVRRSGPLPLHPGTAGWPVSGFGDRAADGDLAPNLGIERLAELDIGLHAECVEHLGEEGSSGDRQHHVDDLSIAETAFAKLLKRPFKSVPVMRSWSLAADWDVDGE